MTGKSQGSVSRVTATGPSLSIRPAGCQHSHRRSHHVGPKQPVRTSTQGGNATVVGLLFQPGIRHTQASRHPHQRDELHDIARGLRFNTHRSTFNEQKIAGQLSQHARKYRDEARGPSRVKPGTYSETFFGSTRW